MMTLQEAIAHAKEKASEQRRRFEDIYGQEETTEAERKEAIACLDCANEHGLLAAWLEELADRREADRWISVKERMPEPRVAVMVYCPERKTQYCAFYADKHWQIFGSYDTVWGEVTHWKPLPKAPESVDV